MIENAAIFIAGHRKFKGVNVEFDDSTIIVLNRVNGEEIIRYSVVEVAKAGMAWDVSEVSQEPDSRIRLVAQQGCGCSGMHPYQVDSTYSGALSFGTNR